MARTVRVVVQIDFEDPPDFMSADKLDSLVSQALGATLKGQRAVLGSPDWVTLRLEQADPGDTDDPEWEVLR